MPVLPEASISSPASFFVTLHNVTLPSSTSGSSFIISNIRSAPDKAESRKLTCCVNWLRGIALCLTYTRYAESVPKSISPFNVNIPPTQADIA